MYRNCVRHEQWTAAAMAHLAAWAGREFPARGSKVDAASYVNRWLYALLLGALLLNAFSLYLWLSPRSPVAEGAYRQTLQRIAGHGGPARPTRDETQAAVAPVLSFPLPVAGPRMTLRRPRTRTAEPSVPTATRAKPVPVEPSRLALL